MTQATTERWSTEGRHVVCQKCDGEPYIDYGRDGGGCPNCAAKAEAAARLDSTQVLEDPAVVVEDHRPWLAIKKGMPYYTTPEEAVNGGDPRGYFPRDLVERRQRWIWMFGSAFTGNIAQIASPDPTLRTAYVRESLEDGARRRKHRTDAEALLKQF